MADAYDRQAWLRRWNADAEAQKIERAAQDAEMARKNEEWQRANGRLPATPSATAVPATPSPAPTPRPIVAPPPTADELEFERVRKEAGARIKRERETRRAEEAGVAMILDAYHRFEPADRTSRQVPRRGTDAQEAAVDLLLSFIPKQRN